MTEERNYVVYMHKNKINNKVYIGITCQNPKKRWSNGNGYKGNVYFYRAIQKYGWNEGFEHIILYENLTQDEANEKEIELIKYYNSTNSEKGYNHTLGGGGMKGFVMSEESRRKSSISHIGKYKGGKNPASKQVVCEDKVFDCAKKCSEYYNIKASTMRGWLNHNHDMPKEWYDKGLHYIDENIEDYTIQIEYKGENSKRSRQVICEDIEFSNIRECSEYYGINYRTMINWLSGNNNMPKEWYNKGLRYKDKSMDGYTIQKDISERRKTSKVVICEGKTFKSIKECAEYYNKSYSSMASWLNKSAYMPQEFYDKGLHFENETMDCYKIQTGILKGKHHPLSKIVICDNKEFSSIKECAEYYKVNNATMNDWLNGKHKMPQQFKDLNLHFKNN